jgi:predicted dehydrogenase
MDGAFLSYKLGVVGMGSWFTRLHKGAQRVGGLDVFKAVGTKPYQAKTQVMQRFNISEDRYYTVDPETGSIPDGFYDGVDVVQIADPNVFHAAQAADALSRGKKVVVEKAFGVTEAEHNGFIQYLKDNGKENDVCLHLHYVDKMPTKTLRDEAPGFLKKHGRITAAYATFFEARSPVDAGRTWLFSPENGGLFMDWIHPMEVLLYAFSPTFGRITEANPYLIDASYDKLNPTGIGVSLGVGGANFTEGAMAHMSIAKGVDKKFERKVMRFLFEDGEYLKLTYASSEPEFTSAARGELEMGKVEGNKFVYTGLKTLIGENSADRYVREMVEFCGGKRLGFDLGQINELFGPQWDYQRLMSGRTPERDKKKIERFLTDGLFYG